ncbi:hypothetical protein EVAR_84202_1 [Eumeta japonica]|uniref:Secreted protein n=1 Tax=Eumeta variegata TaxID=151549 RepID=A0A4C1S7V2_EUMVA|nr:hypothetical protein EVAR_84202_1 [Eumeta japonica]
MSCSSFKITDSLTSLLIFLRLSSSLFAPRQVAYRGCHPVYRVDTHSVDPRTRTAEFPRQVTRPRSRTATGGISSLRLARLAKSPTACIAVKLPRRSLCPAPFCPSAPPPPTTLADLWGRMHARCGLRLDRRGSGRRVPARPEFLRRFLRWRRQLCFLLFYRFFCRRHRFLRPFRQCRDITVSLGLDNDALYDPP